MGTPGRFHEWRARRAADAKARAVKEEHERSELADEQRLERWRSADHELAEMIELARSSGWSGDKVADLSVVLKKGETWLGALATVALIEPRVGPSHTVTNYGGFSYQVTDKARMRTGQYRTTHTAGVESPVVVDTGQTVLTSQRVIFQGEKRAYEWQFGILIGYINDEDSPWTSIQVSNRELVAGLQYDWEHATWFRFRLAWGLAIFQDERDSFVRSLETQRDALGPRPPIHDPAGDRPTSSPSSESPVDLAPDPGPRGADSTAESLRAIEEIANEIDDRLKE